MFPFAYRYVSSSTVDHSPLSVWLPQAEAAAALAHYHARGHAAQRATPRQVQALAALTRGNARELRRASGSLELLSQAL